MKTLYLIRHAKSDWSHIGQPDFYRGINDRWIKSIKKLSGYLKQKHILPDLILSSEAVRARNTAESIAKYIWYKNNSIQYRSEIYDTHMHSFEWALYCIMQQESFVKKTFFIWHNNAITDLAEYVCGKNIWHMPTCSMVSIQFDINDWSEISYDTGQMLSFIKPKEL